MAQTSIYQMLGGPEQRIPPRVLNIMKSYGWGQARWFPLFDTPTIDKTAAARPDVIVCHDSGSGRSNNTPQGSVATNQQTPGVIDANSAFIAVGAAIKPAADVNEAVAADYLQAANGPDVAYLADRTRTLIRVNGQFDFLNHKTREFMTLPVGADSMTNGADAGAVQRISNRIANDQDGRMYYTFRMDLLVLGPQSTFRFETQAPAAPGPWIQNVGNWPIEGILYGWIVDNVSAIRGAA